MKINLIKINLINMKTLYEGILSDMENTLTNGDKILKDFEKEKKEFLRFIGSAKYYKTTGFINDRRASFFVPNVLKQLGYDANYIEITMYALEDLYYIDHGGDWKINVSLTKRTDDNFTHINTVWEKKVYMDRSLFNKWNEVVKDLLKPAAKSMDSFKKFLDNMEKYNEQLTSINSLLK